MPSSWRAAAGTVGIECENGSGYMTRKRTKKAARKKTARKKGTTKKTRGKKAARKKAVRKKIGKRSARAKTGRKKNARPTAGKESASRPQAISNRGTTSDSDLRHLAIAAAARRPQR